MGFDMIFMKFYTADNKTETRVILGKVTASPKLSNHIIMRGQAGMHASAGAACTTVAKSVLLKTEQQCGICIMKYHCSIT